MAAPPKKLKPHHLTMAELVAQGLTDKEVGLRINMSPHTVKITRQSPLFQLEVQRCQKTHTDKLSNHYVDHVLDDGERNVKFLKKVRDGALPDFEEMNAADRVRIRMSAALPLFDRTHPKKSEQDSQPAVQIILQHNEQKVMHESLEAVGICIPQLDDVIKEYEQQELDAAVNEG